MSKLVSEETMARIAQEFKARRAMLHAGAKTATQPEVSHGKGKVAAPPALGSRRKNDTNARAAQPN
jgi:hypothetical protein